MNTVYLIRFCLALSSGCLYDFQYSTLSTFASEPFGISGHNMSKEPPGYSQKLMNKEVSWTRQKYPNVSRHMFGAINIHSIRMILDSVNVTSATCIILYIVLLKNSWRYCSCLFLKDFSLGCLIIIHSGFFKITIEV